MPPYVAFSLISALAYSVGSLFHKEAMARGAGLHRQTALMIWMACAYTLPFLLDTSTPFPWTRLHEPLITAVFFTTGQLLFITALRTGDLSIVAPVAGGKPILNALLVAVLLQTSVAGTTWAACGLSALALLIMRSPNVTTPHSFRRTALITFGSVLMFAFSDTGFQHWAPNWGPLRFTAMTYLFSALASLAFLPSFGTPWRKLPAATRRMAVMGAVIGGVPPVGIGYAIGAFAHAPEINVIYSTRAIMSLLLIWLLARFFGHGERHASRLIFFRRVLAAILLLGAVMLVLR